MAKVTGIGGIFFKSRSDAKALLNWYEKNLGIKLEDFGGAILDWQEDTAEDKGLTVFSIADKDSDWFKPSVANFMINFRVDNMDAIIKRLNAGGVDLHQGPEDHENGIFSWIIDPEGNKIELWEPKLPNTAATEPK